MTWGCKPTNSIYTLGYKTRIYRERLHWSPLHSDHSIEFLYWRGCKTPSLLAAQISFVSSHGQIWPTTWFESKQLKVCWKLKENTFTQLFSGSINIYPMNLDVWWFSLRLLRAQCAHFGDPEWDDPWRSKPWIVIGFCSLMCTTGIIVYLFIFIYIQYICINIISYIYT